MLPYLGTDKVICLHNYNQALYAVLKVDVEDLEKNTLPVMRNIFQSLHILSCIWSIHYCKSTLRRQKVRTSK